MLQVILGCMGIAVGLVVFRKLYEDGKFGRNPITYSLICAVLGLLGIVSNRTIMFSKSFTPEMYTECCISVSGIPRKHHTLRTPEIAAIIMGAMFGVFALTNVALLWADTALKTVKLSRKSPKAIKYLRWFYIAFEVVIVLAFIILFSINSAYLPFLFFGGTAILAGSFIFSSRRIILVLNTAVAKTSVGTQTYVDLARDIKRTTNGVLASCALLVGAAGVLLYFGSGPQDWKDWAPPDQISLHMVFNFLQIFGYLCSLLTIMWFLKKRSSVSSSDSRGDGTHRSKSKAASSKLAEERAEDTEGTSASL